MEEEKKPKIAKKVILVGVIIMLIGIIMVIGGVIKIKNGNLEYEKAYSQYKAEYAEWSQNFIDNLGGNIFNAPTAPRRTFNGALVIAGGFIIFLSFGIIFIGSSPYLYKFGLKTSRETLDYVGDDITELGKKGIDIASPVINKGVDDVIVPTIGKVVNQFKNPTAKTKKCPKCGDVIEDGEIYCSACGARLDKRCSSCGNVNDAKDKFCKNCGNKLD